MKYFRFFIIFLGVIAFSACNDEDYGNSTSDQITNATKNIYKEWGDPSSSIIEYMNEYILTFSEDNMLQYSSNNSPIMITYSFNEDKLDAAVLIAEGDYEPTLKGYGYIGDINYTKVYTNNKENTMCSVYKQSYKDQTYTIIGYTPIETDLYNDLGNIELILNNVSEITSNSAKLSATITGASEAAVCGVKYSTSSSFDNAKKRGGTLDGDKFEISLTGLKAGTDYYYYVYVEDNDVVYTSNASSFTTKN